jgi:hypothetical protein
VRDLRDYLARVPEHRRFLRVSEIDHELELIAAHGRSDVERAVVGSSTDGHLLQMLSVGRGSRHAVVLAMAHPNEPIGALGALTLAQLLVDDAALDGQLGLVWHILPCVDPDGTVLNEGWFAGPFDHATYARSFYRPPFSEQVEWTFQLDDVREGQRRPLKETAALMQVIDAVQPELLVSMHNAETGGLFCYVTDEQPDLTAGLAAIRDITGLPGYLGEPDQPAEALALGLFSVSPTLSGAGRVCSTDYAARHGALGLVTEPPMWADSRADNPSETGLTRGETYRKYRSRLSMFADEHRGWLELAQQRLATPTRLRRAVDEDATLLRDESRRYGEDHDDRPSSVAYASYLAAMLHLQRLRGAGHMLGAIRAELAAGNDDDELARLADSVEASIRHWGAEADDSAAPFVGVSSAVASQVGLALVAAAALR